MITKRKSITSVLFLIMLISLTSAAIENLGAFKQDSAVDLIQSGEGFSGCNITSIRYGESNMVILPEVEMDKSGTEYNYTLLGNFTDNRGEYIVNGFCFNNSESVVWAYGFDITGQGRSVDTAGALVYILLTIAVFIFFIFSLYFAIAIPYSNEINNKGAVIKITKLKYVKLGFFLLTYILFIWFLNVLIAVSDNFVNLTLYYGFVSFLFETLNNLALPVSIFIIVLCLFEIIKDTNIQKAISKFGVAMR